MILFVNKLKIKYEYNNFKYFHIRNVVLSIFKISQHLNVTLFIIYKLLIKIIVLVAGIFLNYHSFF